MVTNFLFLTYLKTLRQSSDSRKNIERLRLLKELKYRSPVT